MIKQTETSTFSHIHLGWATQGIQRPLKLHKKLRQNMLKTKQEHVLPLSQALILAGAAESILPFMKV